MKRRVLSLLLALALACSLLVFPANAAEIVDSGTCGENLTWKLDDDGILTVEGTGEMSYYYSDGQPWVAYKSEIISVVIEDGVTSIADGAFRGFSNMTSLIISDSVAIIEDFAFAECTSLQNVELSNQLTSIGFRSFQCCSSLTHVRIPDSVIWINAYAFYDCDGLVQITIPDSVQYLFEYAFYECDGLSSVTIGSGVDSVDYGTFYGCDNLKCVFLSKNIKSIRSLAFYLTDLTDIYYEGSEEDWEQVKGHESEDLKNTVIHYNWHDGSVADDTPKLHAFILNGVTGDKSQGTDNSCALMYDRLLNNELTGYQIDLNNIHLMSFSSNSSETSVTRSEIKERIQSGFADTTDADISVFYYAGHGGSGGLLLDDVRYYDWQSLANDLAEAVKGKLVVILDTCHAAGFINQGLKAIPEEASRFAVICSSEQDEDSSNYFFNKYLFFNDWYGCFTFYVGEATGFFDDKLKADANGDGVITIGELVDYVSPNVHAKDEKMNVVYNGNYRSLPLFEYHDNINNKLRIARNPTDQEVKLGNTADFSVIASGNGLTYQWQYKTPSGTWKNSTSKTPGYNTDTLTVEATSGRNGYQYRCVVTDASGNTVTSDPATLNVLAITTQPKSTSVTGSAKASFKVAATGAGLTYQWQYKSPSGSWKNCTSATKGYNTATLTVAGVTGSTNRNGYQYRCVVTDAAGNTVTSKAATLTVFAIKTQPKDASTSGSAKASFKVVATGENITYQWQYMKPGGSWKNCTSATEGYNTATLKVAGVTGKTNRNGYQYRCIVTSGNSALVTNAVTLTVN